MPRPLGWSRRAKALRGAALSVAILLSVPVVAALSGTAPRDADNAPAPAVAVAPMSGTSCTEAILKDGENLISTERARYGLTRGGGSETAYQAQNAAEFEGLVGAANGLLALRNQRAQLMAALVEPMGRPFDAIADEVLQLDNEYERALTSATRRYPALATVLEQPGPDDQEQRLLAVTGGPLSNPSAAQPLASPGPQAGAGIVGQALDTRRRAIRQMRSEVAADPNKRSGFESLCVFGTLSKKSVATVSVER